VTREGVDGVVLQQIGSHVVHVYRRVALEPRQPTIIVAVTEDLEVALKDS
jgi:hypothetical protein